MQRIVFYDGDCGFCNKSVAFILKHDKTQKILFASIQSKYTESFFQEKGFSPPDLSTFYFFDNNLLHSKSTAALRVVKHLKFPHSLMAVFLIVPKGIRDMVYNWIARRRQKIFSEYCFVPSDKEKQRFL